MTDATDAALSPAPGRSRRNRGSEVVRAALIFGNVHITRASQNFPRDALRRITQAVIAQTGKIVITRKPAAGNCMAAMRGIKQRGCRSRLRIDDFGNVHMDPCPGPEQSERVARGHQ